MIAIDPYFIMVYYPCSVLTITIKRGWETPIVAPAAPHHGPPGRTLIAVQSFKML